MVVKVVEEGGEVCVCLFVLGVRGEGGTDRRKKKGGGKGMSSNWKGRLCVVLLCVLLVLDVVKGSWLLKGGREVGWYGREEEGGNGTVDDGGGSGGNGTVDDGEGSGGNGTDTVVLEAKKVLKKYREVIIGVSIPLGFLGAFFGYYLFQPFIFLAAAMVSGGFFYLAVQASTVGSVHQTWLTITSSLLGGIIIGITAIKAIRLGVFLMGTISSSYSHDTKKTSRSVKT